MRIKRRLAVNLAAVVALGVVMVAWVVTQIVTSGAFASPMVVTADFESSGGVFTSQEVTYRGVLVGRVGELRLNDRGGVDIELLIDSEWEGRIPSNVSAKVQSKSAVGEQFVNLTPDGSSDEMLHDGDTIARSETELPVDFQALLASLDRVLADIEPGRTRRLVTNLAEGLRGRDEDIAVILESLGRLSDAFADVAREQRRLLANATTAGASFLATKDEFSAALRAADQVLAGIGDEPEELEALLVNNDRLAREALALLSAHGNDLAGGIHELRRFVDFQLRERNELIEKSLDYVPAFLRAIEEASIPWRSPDGREFYRIRVGLIFDNVESSWPCKYRLPEDWERFPHERQTRRPKTERNCMPPGSGGALAAESLAAALESWADENAAPTVATVNFNENGFIWPLDGEVTSFFGERYGGMHTGLDIDGTTGDPVVGAASGKVVLSDTYFGYGTTVIVDHGDGLETLYGHLSKTVVDAGDEIGQGDVLGLVGCTGECSGDHLHFEVRVDAVPVNPLKYLPGGALWLAPGPPTKSGYEPDYAPARRVFGTGFNTPN